MTLMSDAALRQLEDELLGLTSRPSVRQSLSALRVPMVSTPKLVRSVGFLGLIRSIKRRVIDARSLYEEGRMAPPHGLTMIGRKRLRNLRYCIEQILDNNIQGDLIEAGVWRGGAAIYMRAVLRHLGVTDRTIWVADSFQGVPRPDPEYPADADDILHCYTNLAVSQKEVEANFA